MDINGYEKDYQQPGSNSIQDENDDPLVDSHSILNRWKN